MTDRNRAQANPAGGIAIVGMACVFPKAPDLQAFWQNIVSRVDAIGDPPADRGFDQVYDQNSSANNRIYCRRGGYLEEGLAFNPMDFGIMPKAVDGAEPEHFMALKVAHDALLDAGYPELPLSRERTSVILGRGTFVNRGYLTLLQHGFILDQTIKIISQLHPEFSASELESLKQQLQENLPPFSAETSPGLAHSVMAGIIANRLDLHGPSFVVDAACASTLIALENGIADLERRKTDAVIVGGVQISTPPLIHMLFTQLGALSRHPQLRPFDKNADGTMLGEGIGMIVLKRLEDAVRDGHRIYAVIKGVGSSSDGRAKGLLAPRLEGEVLALERAYQAAEVDPRTIELIEAHGTALPVGDATEIQALRHLFGARTGAGPRCAIGSVKSMIGHLIPAAGVAGLIKTALALYHKVLPPTLHCDEPNAALAEENSPLYVNTESHAWIHGNQEYPRRAGVSAFGFGGINTHAVLEEYIPADGDTAQSYLREWDTELCIIEGDSRGDLIQRCEELDHYLSRSAASLLDVACSLAEQRQEKPYRIAIVASSTKELQKKSKHAASLLRTGDRSQIKDRSGIYFFEDRLGGSGRLAFLFPGEGAQYVDMCADLCLHFPEVRECFDLLDRAYADRAGSRLPSQMIFPRTREDRAEAENRIWQMEGAVDAVTTANRALWRLFTSLALKPDVIVGHSSGELMALEAAGAIRLKDQEELISHIRAGNRIIENLSATGRIPEAILSAVGGVERHTVQEVIGRTAGFLCIAMDNCPHQFVLCGSEQATAVALDELRLQGAICHTLPFNRAYHTERFEIVQEPLQEFFEALTIASPEIPIYSCLTAGQYPTEPREIRQLAVKQWARPVRFRETIEALYEQGVRVFVEAGPRSNLTGFVNDILKGKNFVAVAANVQRRSGITQMHHALGQLIAHGIPVQLARLYSHRNPARLDFSMDPAAASGKAKQGLELSLALPTLNFREKPATLAAPPVHQSVRERRPSQPAPSVASETGMVPGHVERGRGAQPAAVGYAPAHPEAMAEYFRTMENFLETQERVMAAYLAGETDPARRGDLVGEHPTADMHTSKSLAPAVEPGIPPVTGRQEMAGKSGGDAGAGESVADQGHQGGTRKSGTAAQSSPGKDRKALFDLLLTVVSDRTGYPVEMLDPAVNIESDLGIDSIKKVEILGTLVQQAGIPGREKMERLQSMKTLNGIVDCLLENENTEGQQKPPAPESRKVRPTAGGPLLGKVMRLVPEREIVTEYQLSADRDLFLQDHTLGGRVSRVDENLWALPLMPLSMSLEMVAEAAFQLMPGRSLVGMRDIKAHSWVSVADGQVDLQTHALVNPQDHNEVNVLLRRKDGEAERVVLEGVVIFGDYSHEPPMVERLQFGDEKDPGLLAAGIYPEIMFHGPIFQSIKRVRRLGSDGIEAELSLPGPPFFRDVTEGEFLAAPVLLDGAGQAVGIWAHQSLDSNFVTFPTGIQDIRFFSAGAASAAEITCQAKVRLQGENSILSDCSLLQKDGALFVRIKGLQHRRVNLPEIFHWFRVSRETFLSSPWQGAVEPYNDQLPLACRGLNSIPVGFWEKDDFIWRKVLANIVLSRQERQVWRELPGPERRRTEWLLARLAGKEAVRELLKAREGFDIWPADIEIVSDAHGCPQVRGPWQAANTCFPALALSHRQGVAVALAAAGVKGIGIDLEILEPKGDDFALVAFSPEERSLIASVSGTEQTELYLRLWCAKEATAKAFGLGLVNGPGDFAVTRFNRLDGMATLQIAGELARRMPGKIDQVFNVYTDLADGFVTAACLIH